jgi:hypothetical protein
LLDAIDLYKRHGLFTNGKSLDEQSDDLWKQMNIFERMINYEVDQQANGNNYTVPENEEQTTVEPFGFTTDMM